MNGSFGSLAEDPSFYRTLVLSSPVATVVLDTDGRVFSCNPAFERLFGFTQDEARGRHIDELVVDEGLFPEASSYTRRTLDLGETIRATGRRRNKYGAYLDLEIQGVPIILDGQARGILALYFDLTSRRRSGHIRQPSEDSLLMVLDSLDADIYTADLDSYEILFMNRHMRDSFGGDFTGKICHRVFRKEAQPCGHCSNARLVGADGKPSGVYVWEGKNPITGRWYKNSDRVIPWNDGGLVRLQIATDITELKEAEARLEHQATHDPLTGLPNRILFADRLAHAINMARRARSRLALLFLDLDEFKKVNDNLGHLCGDELLKGVAFRMRSAIRECDTVARISGDEFAIVLEELKGQDAAKRLAARILAKASPPYLVDGYEVTVSFSIGIAVYPEDGDTMERLLRSADEAMYYVKLHGRSGIAASSEHGCAGR